VFGIGGVGGYCVEALARSGVGSLALFDDDQVCLTNINRQIIATRKTIGRAKVDVMKERILDINPNAEVEANKTFYSKDNADDYDFSRYDYIIDAIDTVSSKLLLAERAQTAGKPIISCMGAGNKLNPTMLEVADIYQTTIDPLAKVVRKELRKRGVQDLKVVYSREVPIEPLEIEGGNCRTDCICTNKDRTCAARHQIPGSVSFVPSVAGLIIASEVVKDITGAGRKAELE
jgi:tRNA A37 threonylcarbamoyladenosine dehydratase